MGWKIPEIKIRVPEVKAGRVMPKPRVRKPAGEKIDGFSLTIFSSNRVPIESKHIDVIRVLIEADGNRKIASAKLGICQSVISYHTKKIRNLPLARLQKYADELKITVAEIMKACADLESRKWITLIDVVKALLASDGSRTIAGQNLGISNSATGQYAQVIRRMSDAGLRKYADKLNTTVGEIKRVCADLGHKKGIARIDIIRELLACDGNRAVAARILGIKSSVVSRHTKKIRRLPDTQLQKYAKQLNTNVNEIKRVCADLDSKKGVTHIDIIKELLASEGSRTNVARNLGITQSVIGEHAKNIRKLSNGQLQKYAKQLNTTAEEIMRVCADLTQSKDIKNIDIIRELLAANGNRTIASRSLGIHNSVVSIRAKEIARLPDADLQKYVNELNKEPQKAAAIYDIRNALAPRITVKTNFERRVQIMRVIRALLASDGSRTAAAKSLQTSPANISKHAKNIRRLSDTQLQKYAEELDTAVDEIKRVCADFDNKKDITHTEVIRILLTSHGNKTTAAKSLKTSPGNISKHAKNIRGLPDTQLQKYADELDTAVDEIKRVCADSGRAKGVTHIEAILELLKTNGNRTIAAKNLKITDGSVAWHAGNIMRLPEAELTKYAAELGVSVEQIKGVCATRLERAKKLFKSGN